MTLTDLLKNEYVKQAVRLTGVRKAPFTAPARTTHYRCPLVEAGEGLVTLRGYEGPRIQAAEWETLEYTTYSSDPYTYFAPITSPTGRVEMIGAKEAGKEELECVPTPNADKCPTIMKWLESMGARYGRVQLLRMKPNTLRECLWGLHQDNNNLVNPPGNGWIVRVWHKLTDDSTSTLVVRQGEFARRSEVQVALPRSQQVVVDSERLWHGGFHAGSHTRYALIASVESSPALNDWIQSQLPTATARLPLQRKRTRSGLVKNSLPGALTRRLGQWPRDSRQVAGRAQPERDRAH